MSSNQNTDNRYYKQQRWLAAHNGWNTTPPLNNQCFTITQLLDYGVRGFALDIWGSDETSLYLQHGPKNPVSSTPWKKVRDELKTWLDKHTTEIVTLFFESYLTGPKPGQTQSSPLAALDDSLKDIGCYKSGKAVQEDAILKRNFSYLINGTDEQGNVVTKPQRLFAFIEKEPDEGVQYLFPVMRKNFAENGYGDGSLKPGSWTELRGDSSRTNPLTFLNHFGNNPTGSEWNRNNPDLICKHARDFLFNFGGRYPNFLSLDYINWNTENPGPIEAAKLLQSQPDLKVTPFKWAGKNKVQNSFDDVDVFISDQRINDFQVEIGKGQGIIKIKPITTGAQTIIKGIQLVNVPGYGVVNMRIQTGKGWGKWLAPDSFEKITDINDPNLAHHVISGTLVGFCCRTSSGYGVVDFAAACLP